MGRFDEADALISRLKSDLAGDVQQTPSISQTGAWEGLDAEGSHYHDSDLSYAIIKLLQNFPGKSSINGSTKRNS